MNPRPPLQRASHSTTSLQFSFLCGQRRLARGRQGVRKTLDAKSVFFRRAWREPRPSSACLCLHEWEEKIGHFRVAPSLCFKSRVSAKPRMWKLFHILIQIKLIFTRKVLHFTSFWKWEFLELGNSLFLLFYRLLDQVYPILFDWNNALFLLQYFAVEQERERTV